MMSLHVMHWASPCTPYCLEKSSVSHALPFPAWMAVLQIMEVREKIEEADAEELKEMKTEVRSICGHGFTELQCFSLHCSS